MPYRMMHRDFKSQSKIERSNTNGAKHHHILIAAGILLGLGFMLTISPNTATATRTTQTSDLKPFNVAPDPVINQPGDEAIKTKAVPTVSSDDWRQFKVKNGDNLSLIFDRANLSAQQLHRVMQIGTKVKILKNLYPGKIVKLKMTDNQLTSLRYPIDLTKTLTIDLINKDYIANIEQREYQVRTSVAAGKINNSLFLAGKQASLSDNIIMELAGIFGWDVDFALDIRKNDSFSVIYEELFLDGEKVKNGNILAAEFINQGNQYRAIRFTDKNGKTDYFSPDGKSMRKAFLRTPVDFTRISSRFSLKRKHPVLNRIRAHKGVDYSAPRGTPIKSTGQGKVIFRGKKGGFGNVVIIQHGSKYRTVYAHLSKFSKKARRGRYVNQGQTIGYVGSSGLATGPHLHYEFRVNGVHRNPLTIKLPAAAPLKKEFKQQFNLVSAPFLAQLDVIGRSTMISKAEIF